MGLKNDIRPASSRSAAEPQRCHFCRGCGRELPLGFRGHFHKECLRADKRSRICEQRRREEERFRRRLEQQRCPHCGARYQRSDGATEASCEASQPPQDRDPPVDEGIRSSKGERPRWRTQSEKARLQESFSEEIGGMLLDKTAVRRTAIRRNSLIGKV